jgi:hypothetical protein
MKQNKDIDHLDRVDARHLQIFNKVAGAPVLELKLLLDKQECTVMGYGLVLVALSPDQPDAATWLGDIEGNIRFLGAEKCFIEIGLRSTYAFAAQKNGPRALLGRFTATLQLDGEYFGSRGAATFTYHRGEFPSGEEKECQYLVEPVRQQAEIDEFDE